MANLVETIQAIAADIKSLFSNKVGKNDLFKNVMDFGATNAGVASTANYNAVVAAINAVADGGTVYFPEGIFDWTGVVTVTKLRVTFTGPGIVRGGFKIGDGSARNEIETKFVNLRFIRPLNLSAYPGKGYADGSSFIQIDRARRVVVDNCELYGAAYPIHCPQNANTASHDISMLRIKNNFFNECDWAVYGDIATGVTYEAIADSQVIGNIVNRSYVGGFFFEGVDGVQLQQNVFFMQNFNNTGGRFQEKLNNIWLKKCTWTHIDNNNLFEAGLESIKIDAAKNYKITDNLIAWAGQRAMADAILVGSYSTVYGSGEWASGVIAGNDIQFYTKSAIKVTGNHYELSLGLNTVRYNASAASYKGSPALSTATHYRHDLSGVTGMKAGDIDNSNAVLARDGHYDLYPAHGYVRSLTRLDVFCMQGSSFRGPMTVAKGGSVAVFGLKDAADSSTFYGGEVTITVSPGTLSSSKKAIYKLLVTKTSTGDALVISQRGPTTGALADDPSFTWAVNASNNTLVATGVGETAGDFNFTARFSDNLIVG